MSLLKSGSPILRLPDEVLVHIISFLPSVTSIVALARTCARLRKLATDVKVIRHLDFGEDPDVTIETLSFFTQPDLCAKVERLKLSGACGLQPDTIQSELGKMVHLVELDVRGIKFTPEQFSIILSKLSSLAELSFTWPWPEIDASDVVQEVGENAYRDFNMNTWPWRWKHFGTPQQESVTDKRYKNLKLLNITFVNRHKFLSLGSVSRLLFDCPNLENFSLTVRNPDSSDQKNLFHPIQGQPRSCGLVNISNKIDNLVLDFETVNVLPPMTYSQCFVRLNIEYFIRNLDFANDANADKIDSKKISKLNGWLRFKETGKVKWSDELELKRIFFIAIR